MKQKQTSCAQGVGRALRGQGCCLLTRPVLWCFQLMDNRRTTKKARQRTSQDEGSDKAEKNKSIPQRGGWLSLNLYLPVVSRWTGVISHDISRHIVILYSISCGITRYDVPGIEILYPYPDFFGLISRYRIPSKYFSIPNAIFCPVRCPNFWCTRELTKWLFGVELQKQWYLLENIYMYAHMGVRSRSIWMPCFETIT